MSQENVDVVRLAYDVAYVERSVEKVRHAFADDYVFHSRREFPGRARYGPDEVPQLWADLDDTYMDFELVPEDFTPVGDHVLVTVRMGARLRASGTRIESTIHHVWLVRDGTPRETRAYSTREEALEAVGLSE